MKYFISAILFLCITSVIAGDTTHIKAIESAKPQYGSALKAKDLKGKVILFEYWGLN